MNIRHWLAALASITVLAAQAAGYPERPVNVIVPFPPGGSTDMVARLVAQKMGEKLHGTFVVENKAGATGTIGANFVAKAAPDGYTILVSSLAPFVVNPHLQKNLPYDPSKDFDLLSVAVQAPNVLVANPAEPVNNVAELIAFIKKNPDQATFASSGAGSSDHLTAELFWQQTGTHGVHVPYKGGAPAIQDLIAGHVHFSFQNLNAVYTYIQTGKLKVLAITSSKRSPLLPNVPTLAESGVKNADVYSWQAIAAPKGIPADVKAKLVDAIQSALKDPGVSKQMTDIGFEIVGNSPAEFTKFQAAESARWKKVIETAHIEAN